MGVYYYLAWKGVNCMQVMMMAVSRMFCREEPRSLIFLCLVYEVVWGKLVPYIDWYGPSLHTDMLDVSRRGVEEGLWEDHCHGCFV